MRPLALHDFHLQYGAQFGELAGSEVVQSYGDPQQEYLAACSDAGLIDLSYRDVLRVTGEDAIRFLQGMLTQDVRALPEDGVAYAALCTAKGAMVADARVLKRRGEVFLETEPGRGSIVKTALERFVISEDVEISDASGNWVILGLRGPSSPRVLERLLAPLPEANRIQDGAAGAPSFVAEHSWPNWKGVDLWLRPQAAVEFCHRLLAAGEPGPVQPVGLEAAELLRIEAGLPRFGAEMNEGTIPLEADLERAISFTKGCYIGQEVIARATYRGHVNKKLAGVILPDEFGTVPAELRRGEKAVGVVTSSAFSWKIGNRIGLAMLQRDYLSPGTRLDVGGKRDAVTVQALPFVGAQP